MTPQSNNLFGLKQLSKKEFIQKTKAIKENTKESLQNLTEIYTTESFTVHGYSSFKEYIHKRLPQADYHATLKQAKAGDVAMSIGGMDMVGQFSDASMRAMYHYSHEERQLIFKALMSKRPSKINEVKWLTENRVKEVAIELFSDEASASKAEEKWRQKKKDFIKLVNRFSGQGYFAKHVMESFCETFGTKVQTKAICFLNDKVSTEGEQS